jgi:mRNA-degrading endonuclease RelE of RelBE toxin-antitoxin system
MKYKIYATSTAKKETADAVFYYENAQPGLGLAFLKEIENKYDAISKNPFAYGYIDNKNLVRDVLVKRFPFVIIYKVESDSVVILSVHHTHKIPKY